jgi:CRISPR type I-E-associated protein CasB/Cse2
MTTVTTSGAVGERTGPSSRAMSLAGLVQTELVGRGGRAELRRMRTPKNRVPPAVFWALLTRVEAPPGEERLWQHLLPLMTDVPFAKRSLGTALRAAEVSEHRLLAFLRQERQGALRDLPRLIRRIDGGVNWAEIAQLVVSWDRTDAGRYRVARDFFNSRTAAAEPAED